MQGMFRANGGCGYVKKPDLLLKVGPDNEVFDPKKKGLPVKKILKVIDNSKISFFDIFSFFSDKSFSFIYVSLYSGEGVYGRRLEFGF